MFSENEIPGTLDTMIDGCQEITVSVNFEWFQGRKRPYFIYTEVSNSIEDVNSLKGEFIVLTNLLYTCVCVILCAQQSIEMT